MWPGAPPRAHVVPLAFRYNPETDTIDVGGHNFAKRKKYRDVHPKRIVSIGIEGDGPFGLNARSVP